MRAIAAIGGLGRLLAVTDFPVDVMRSAGVEAALAALGPDANTTAVPRKRLRPALRA